MPNEYGNIYASLADIRGFIMDHYQAVGGLSALMELNKLEGRILNAIAQDGEQ